MCLFRLAASAEAMTTKTTTEPSKPSPPQSKPTPPNPLRHARHQPTRAIYIDNLRRPLDVGELKDLLLEHGELDEEAGGVKGGMWVSGVKSHVYAVVSQRDQSFDLVSSGQRHADPTTSVAFLLSFNLKNLVSRPP